MVEKQLGQYLRALRKSFSYTQEYVASHLDVSRQAYSHYETNRALPSNEAIYKIANLYGISADSLIEMSVLSDPAIPYPSRPPHDEEMEHLLAFLNNEKNAAKLKHLPRKEKELIYYFENLSLKDQNEILEILKIKLKYK